MKNTIFAAILMIGISLPVLAEAQGTIYISNLDQTPTSSLAVGSDSWIAQGFYILQNDPNTYVLNSIQLLMAPATGSPRDFAVSIYSAPFGGFGSPAEHYVGTLSGASDPTSAGVFTYTASGIRLSSSEFYWVIATSSTAITQGAYHWSAVDGGLGDGSWNINNGYSSSPDGTIWAAHLRQGALQIAINATPVPEPATWALAGFGLLLLGVWRHKPWSAESFDSNSAQES